MYTWEVGVLRVGHGLYGAKKSQKKVRDNFLPLLFKCLIYVTFNFFAHNIKPVLYNFFRFFSLAFVIRYVVGIKQQK